MTVLENAEHVGDKTQENPSEDGPIRDGATQDSATDPEPEQNEKLRFSEGMDLPYFGKVKWKDLRRASWEWLSDPVNIAVLLWILAVTVAGGMLFMVMTGMLNAQIPDKSNRQIWGEALNQILTALFTLYCLLVQPLRIMYAIRVSRWADRDKPRLRTVFIKGGVEIPNERTHIAVVVVLLNLNCAFQYALAGVMWGIPMSVRPALAVGLLLAGAIGCAACAGLYCLVSPLGRPKPVEPLMTMRRSHRSTMRSRRSTNSTTPGSSLPEAESGNVDEEDLEIAMSRSLRMDGKDGSYVTLPVVEDLHWTGDMWECFSDWGIVWRTMFCFCCTFGRNLQRAGMGSKYLHTVMLALFLVAPFLICEFAALQVADKRLASALIAIGVLLSWMGLLYGGYWRLQLLKAFRLPRSPLGVFGDFCLWLTCFCPALCQEVRTVDAYGLHVDFYSEKVPNSGQVGSENAPAEALPETEQKPKASSEEDADGNLDVCKTAPQPAIMVVVEDGTG